MLASLLAVTGDTCRGRKLVAVNEVESNPAVPCNLPDGTFDSMLSDFHVAPAVLCSVYFIYFLGLVLSFLLQLV